MEKRDSTTGLRAADVTPQSSHTPPPAGRPIAADAAPSNVALNAAVQARIGRELRAVFDEVVNEPVPERFLQLLAALEAKQDGTS